MHAASDIVAVPFDDTWYSWNVTDDVQSALGQKLTLALTVEDTGEGFSTSFYSKDGYGYENCSKLVIEYWKGDAEPPLIGTVSQEPEVPDDGEEVAITVNVTDEESGMHNSTLSYSTDDGDTWTNVTMSKSIGNNYTGEIPGLPVGTSVQYKIIAYDNAGNFAVDDNTGQYYLYLVIPEFPSWAPILLLLILLTVAMVIYKRRLPKTQNN